MNCAPLRDTSETKPLPVNGPVLSVGGITTDASYVMAS